MSKTTIIKTTEQLIFKVKAINIHCVDTFDAVKKSLDALLNDDLCTLLKTIPVTDFANAKSGIRTTTLIENGYQTYEDIYRASLKDLEAIKGISAQAALTIKDAVKQTAKALSKELKLQLDIDHLSAAQEELIFKIALYRQALANQSQIDDIHNFNHVITDLDFLKNHQHFWNYTFASKAQKTKIDNALIFLEEFSKTYQETIETSYQNIKIINLMKHQQALDDFKENSIAYFHIIETLKPDIFNKTDETYGIDAKIYQNVQAVKLNLNGLKCQLRNYQALGVKFILAQKHVLLGDEMGLGKTIEAIAAMVALKNIGKSHFVVVCPASVLINWEREIVKHSTLTTYVVHGEDALEALTKWEYQGGVAITTYEAIKTFAALAFDSKIDLLTIDEAHYIKNPHTKRSQNCQKLCKISDYLLLMTGTPLENNLEEMLNIIKILDEDLVKSIKHSLSLYNLPLFKKKIAKLYYRRRREDVLNELPSLVENDEWCDMTSEDQTIYKQSILEHNYAAARQVSWNNPKLSTSAKANRLLEIIEDAKQQHYKVIVFSFFLHTTETIANLIDTPVYGPITGATVPAKRQAIIDAFEKAPGGSVLVAQIVAGGTGLNIQSANIVIICEPQFKPSIENQAIARSYRMGQTRTVFVHRLLCNHTLDEKLRQALIDKQALFDKYADESLAGLKDLEITEQQFKTIFETEYQKFANEKPLT